MANLNVPGNSILTMPLPDSRAAPEKFKGRYTKIKSFLTHFELLLEQNNVLSDKDKCELITRYCSRKVTEFIQALPSYTDKKWAKLKEDLLKYYDADLDNKKYRIKDLVKLVKACKEKKMKNLSHWREYGRKFITIGGWLLRKKKISEEEYATYYWNGIPKSLRSKLENRLLAKDPVRSLATPFGVDEINSGVEALLQRDRFDMNFAGSDDGEDSDDEDDESDESSDSEGEDELRRARRRVRKHARYTKKKGSVSDSDDSDDEGIPTSKPQRVSKEIKRKVNGKDEPEIETLIKQLNTMSLDDPGYAALVFRAFKIDPDVLKVVRPSVFVTQPTLPNSVPQFLRATQAFPSFQPQRSSQTVPSFTASRPQGNRNMPDEDADRCYGCYGHGHRMSMCPEMQELMGKNVVMRNGMGRYVYGDGRPIRRLPGESIVSAVKHEMGESPKNAPSSHLIKIVELDEDERTDLTYYCNLDSDTSDSNDEGCDEIISAAVLEQNDEDDDWYGFAYPVTRSGRTTSAKRKEAMEPEYEQPKRRRQAIAKNDEGKENTRTTAPTERPIKSLPTATRMQVPVPIPAKKDVRESNEKPKNDGNRMPRGPVPVDVRSTEYNGKDDDEIMEDVTNIRQAQPKKHEVRAAERMKPSETVPASQSPEKHPRQSEVAAQVKPMGVLNQVLNTRIDLAIGEVLGISKDLSALLGDKIKPKSTKPPVPAIATALPIATSFYTKNRGLLIQLHMQCDGRPITAIIDTGSQLNIVNKNICDSKIMRPVDNKEKISVADANGGQGKLEGMVANVPLNCGDVATKANLYVGTHVPFELLLGRPWQRGNFVSIDERRNGTYLLFKDPKNLEPRYEILVAIDRSLQEKQYEMPVWNVPDNPISYHVSIDQAPETTDTFTAGPTTRIIQKQEEFPNLDSGLSDFNHTTTANRLSLQRPSISQMTDANFVGSQASPGLAEFKFRKQNYEALSIKAEASQDKKSPEHGLEFQHSMSTGLQFLETEVQDGSSAIAPLGSKPLIRLDSEILVAALADVPFLKRTQNLHPFILSTAEGFFLGNQIDVNGQKHDDYVFLHAGLFDLSGQPYSITPSAAFVRVYPDLRDGPPQPWILPYMSNPPEDIMVSTQLPQAVRRIKSSNNLIKLRKQFEKTDEKITIPTLNQTDAKKTTPPPIRALPSIKEEKLVSGEIAHIFSKPPPVSADVTSQTQSLDFTAPTNSTLSHAHALISKESDSFSYINKSSSNFTNILRPRKPTFSTDTDNSDNDNDSVEDCSSTSTKISSSNGSDSDADGEMDMELEIEMDWEDMKAEIKDELMKELEKDSKDFMDADKENNGTPRKISHEIYNRLYSSYVQVTGEIPTEAIMNRIQDSYIMLLERNIVPFVPRSAPDRPTISSAGVSGNYDATASVVPPKLSPRDSKTHTYAPIVSSPLANHSTHIIPEREAIAVYMVQEMDHDSEASSNRSASMPALVSTDSIEVSDESSQPNEPNNTPDYSHNSASPEIEMSDVQNYSQRHSEGISSLIATVPSSPIHTEDEGRANRFQRPPKIGREELITKLQAEANYLNQQLESTEPAEAAIHQHYLDRLNETLAKIKAMDEGRVGELHVGHLFLHGLMNIINIQEFLSTPLPFNSPPMVPVAPPPESVEESLLDAIKDVNPRDIEQHSIERGESPITYNQTHNAPIPQCPSQPSTNMDPRTIPIANRAYFPGGANDFIKRAGAVKRYLYVDIRSITVVTDPTHVPAAFIRHFTELQGNLEPYIFPGRLAPVHDWPLDVPQTRAVNYQERVEELRRMRREAEILYQATTRALPKNQIGECLRPHITLYKRIADGSLQLSPIKVDRIYFWSRLHPTWNPILKPIESAFLRGAIYVYYGSGQPENAEELERLLRTPQYDDWEVRELVSMGALDSEFRESEALAYFQALDDEHWEFHANEEAFRKAATDILEMVESVDSNDDKKLPGNTGQRPYIETSIGCDPCGTSDCIGCILVN